MKIICFLFFLGAFSLLTTAQQRYAEAVFDSVSVQTYTYAVKQGQTLDLDLYTPAFDAAQERPLIIYVHGGGFSSGTRNSQGISDFCYRLATYGYSAVSISYRLTRKDQPTAFGCDCPAADKRNTFQWAVEDLQDVTFFLIQNREAFGINPQQIILAGSSAGAETVLNAAYQPPYCYGLDSGPVSYAGVISMAGAIPDITKLYNESAVPSLLFHGTCDNLVPYATASHHHCQPNQPGYLVLYGSFPIAEKLKELQVPGWLHTTCGGRHELASSPMTHYFDEIIEFCHQFVLLQKGETRHTIIPGNPKNCNYQQFDFCTP